MNPMQMTPAERAFRSHVLAHLATFAGVIDDDPVFINSGANPMVNGLISFANRIQGISRKYFLMSDAKARRNEHFGWDTRGLPAVSDTSYDNRRW